jgi:hypothetical protein
MFGVTLVFVNCLGLGMVVSSQVSERAMRLCCYNEKIQRGELAKGRGARSHNGSNSGSVSSLRQLVKPVMKVSNKLSRKHVHNAPLKGVDLEHADWGEFEQYFRQLAASTPEEAGWETMRPKDWGARKKEAKAWLAETGAVGEWRCASGNGPIDQCRVAFEVEHKLEDVWAYLTTFTKPIGNQLEINHLTTNKDETMDVYLAVRLPWPLDPRDFKVR